LQEARITETRNKVPEHGLKSPAHKEEEEEEEHRETGNKPCTSIFQQPAKVLHLLLPAQLTKEGPTDSVNCTCGKYVWPGKTALDESSKYRR
jgi:hypothetical protein